MRRATPGSIIPLVLRRMRAPLLLLITNYSVAVLGFTLIPGVDDAGEPWRMGFFHAFYFVSYMATTIGFGEIPYAFTDAQRLWATFSIYLTVIAWFYALVTIIGLIQEPTFRQAVVRNRFRRNVRNIDQPFYLVCGYGDTGSRLVETITRRGRLAVVLDIDPERAADLSLTELPLYVPVLCADAGQPDTLAAAGITSPHCVAVLGVTNSDQTNLYIAISGKLLNPRVKVICRAERAGTAENMRSFGTDHVVDPFASFARELALAVERPDLHRLERRLASFSDSAAALRRQPPRGRWIVCGYGRLGQALHRALEPLGIALTIIEVTPRPELPPDYVHGRGTEAITLREAGIDTADAVVAATSSDADNLSIIMTARELNSDVFLVGRQTEGGDERIFQAAQPDMVMLGSRLIAARMLNLLAQPLLSEFLELAAEHPSPWVEELLEKLEAVCLEEPPEIWSVTVDEQQAEAVLEGLGDGRALALDVLLREPHDRKQRLAALPLLLARGNDRIALPAEQELLAAGDRLLFCGRADAVGRQRWVLRNRNALAYVTTGDRRPGGLLWRWLNQRLGSHRRNSDIAQNDTAKR
jgi:voltage-gated potassium channel